MDLLLESPDHVGKVVGSLGVFGKTGLLGLLLIFWKLDFSELLYLQLAGKDVHGELFEVFLVLLIHLVEHLDVLEEDDLMILEALDYLVNVDFGLVVLGLHGGDGLLGLLEESLESFLFLFTEVEAFELNNEIGEHIADFTEVLGPDGLESVLRELGYVLLGGAAVIEHLLGVHYIDLGDEFSDSRFLLGGKGGEVNAFFLNNFFFSSFGNGSCNRGRLGFAVSGKSQCRDSTHNISPL